MNDKEFETYFNGLFEEAHKLADRAEEKQHGRVNPSQEQDSMLEGNAADMRWFVFPSEVTNAIAKYGTNIPARMLDSCGPLQPQSIGLNLANGEAKQRLPHGHSIMTDTYVPAVGKIKYPYRSAHSDLLEPPVWAQPNIVKKMNPPKDGQSTANEDGGSSKKKQQQPASKTMSAVSIPPTVEKFHGVLLHQKVEVVATAPAPVPVEEVPTTDAAVTNPVKEKLVKGPPKLPVPPKKMMRPIGQGIDICIHFERKNNIHTFLQLDIMLFK
jgi:hypothetical protein